MLEQVRVVESAPVKESVASRRICDDCAEHEQEAKLIQSSLLPTKGLRHESVEIAFRCMPFSEVGGDFLDFFLLPGFTRVERTLTAFLPA